MKHILNVWLYLDVCECFFFEASSRWLVVLWDEARLTAGTNDFGLISLSACLLFAYYQQSKQRIMAQQSNLLTFSICCTFWCLSYIDSCSISTQPSFVLLCSVSRFSMHHSRHLSVVVFSVFLWRNWSIRRDSRQHNNVCAMSLCVPAMKRRWLLQRNTQ